MKKYLLLLLFIPFVSLAQTYTLYENYDGTIKMKKDYDPVEANTKSDFKIWAEAKEHEEEMNKILEDAEKEKKEHEEEMNKILEDARNVKRAKAAKAEKAAREAEERALRAAKASREAELAEALREKKIFKSAYNDAVLRSKKISKNKRAEMILTEEEVLRQINSVYNISTESSEVSNKAKQDISKSNFQTVKKNISIEEIKKLKELLDLGIITKSEYDKKAKLLKKIILDN